MPLGHIAIVERLLQQKADVNASAADDKDFTPGLNYVRLSRLQLTKDVMFETEFSRDHFPKVVSRIIKRQNC